MGLWIWRSKTDEEDLGAPVVRQCVCGEASLAHCPSCVLWRHAQGRRLALQGHGAQDGVGKAPLFDNGQGQRLTVAEVLVAVEDTAVEAGESLRTKEGLRRFGTHSMRVRGACMAYAAGLPRDHYHGPRQVDEPGWYEAIPSGGAHPKGLSGDDGDRQGYVRRGGRWSGESPVGPHEDERERRQEVPAGHIQVLLGTTGVLHRPLGFEGPPEQWTTFCGIRWASKGVAGDFSYKKDRKCGRCFGSAAAP